jgi:hypothetical protein
MKTKQPIDGADVVTKLLSEAKSQLEKAQSEVKKELDVLTPMVIGQLIKDTQSLQRQERLTQVTLFLIAIWIAFVTVKIYF